MRIYTKTESLNKGHLRLLSVKTGKSIKTLKRYKGTYSFLMYTSIDDCYSFTGYSYRIALRVQKSAKEFFQEIEQHQLLGLL